MWVDDDFKRKVQWSQSRVWESLIESCPFSVALRLKLALDISSRPILWSLRKRMQVISNRYPGLVLNERLESEGHHLESLQAWIESQRDNCSSWWTLVTVRTKTEEDRRPPSYWNCSAGFSCLRTLVTIDFLCVCGLSCYWICKCLCLCVCVRECVWGMRHL